MPSFEFKVKLQDAVKESRLPSRKLVVLEELAHGFSNKMIAEDLEISVKSVERILSELNKKFSKSGDYANFHQLFNPRMRLLLSLIAGDIVDFDTEIALRYIDNLGPKLSETLNLVAVGLSNKSIGDFLSINEKTVELRLTQLFDYFNVDTKIQSYENPRVILLISAYCRGNLSKSQLKRLHRETLPGRIEVTMQDKPGFVSMLGVDYKIIG